MDALCISHCLYSCKYITIFLYILLCYITLIKIQKREEITLPAFLLSLSYIIFFRFAKKPLNGCKNSSYCSNYCCSCGEDLDVFVQLVVHNYSLPFILFQFEIHIYYTLNLFKKSYIKVVDLIKYNRRKNVKIRQF